MLTMRLSFRAIGSRNRTPAKGNSVDMLAGTSLEATEMTSARGFDRHLFSLFIHAGQSPALATTSNRLALVGLKNHPLNKLVGTDLDGGNVLSLRQLESSFVATLGSTREFIVAKVLDVDLVDHMAIGIDGDFFDGAIVVMIKFFAVITTVKFGNGEFRLFVSLLFRLCFSSIFLVVSLFFILGLFFVLFLRSSLNDRTKNS
jgi:hypothetical protein